MTPHCRECRFSREEAGQWYCKIDNNTLVNDMSKDCDGFEADDRPDLDKILGVSR